VTVYLYLLICYAIASVYLAADVAVNAPRTTHPVATVLGALLTLAIWPAIAVYELVAIVASTWSRRR
jgi:hypothetical protein